MDSDKQQIRAQLVPIMISLGSAQTAKVQSQIGEALAHVASIDFPLQWEGLIDVSVATVWRVERRGVEGCAVSAAIEDERCPVHSVEDAVRCHIVEAYHVTPSSERPPSLVQACDRFTAHSPC